MKYIKTNNLFTLQTWAIQVAMDQGINVTSGTVYWGSGFCELESGRWVWKLTDKEILALPDNIADKVRDDMGGTLKELPHFKDLAE